MMRSISRGEGPFSVREFDYENLYFKGSHDGAPYAFCHAQIVPGVAYLHLYVERFGREVLREMRRDFEALKDELREHGARRVLGTHEINGCEKWLKFIGFIGFKGAIDTVTPEGVPCKLALMEI